MQKPTIHNGNRGENRNHNMMNGSKTIFRYTYQCSSVFPHFDHNLAKVHVFWFSLAKVHGSTCKSAQNPQKKQAPNVARHPKQSKQIKQASKRTSMSEVTTAPTPAGTAEVLPSPAAPPTSETPTKKAAAKKKAKSPAAAAAAAKKAAKQAKQQQELRDRMEKLVAGLGIRDLKEVLKSNKLKVSGNREAIEERLMQNTSKSLVRLLELRRKKKVANQVTLLLPGEKARRR